MFAYATVVMNILDVNDHAPVINVLSLMGGCGGCGDNISIPPTTPVGTVVASLGVTDADTGISGQFDCSVTSKYDAFEVMRNSDSSMTVRTTLRFDMLDLTSMSFDLVCRDRGIPILTGELRVLVNIVTNHPPVLTKTEYSINVRGDYPANFTIIRVQASDPDFGYAGRFYFEIDSLDANSSASLFSLNSSSGEIGAKVVLNRESALSYAFRVLATDQGIPPMTSTALVRINVTRVALEKPLFLQSSYVFNVMENLNPPISVGHVYAVDSDWPPFNLFTFSIVDTNAFQVDPNSGLIQTKIELDKEMTSSVQFRIKATDLYNADLYSFADVTVNILDTNDNRPFFLFPSPGNDTLFVFNSLRQDQIIGRLIARDYDSDPHAIMRFGIVAFSENSNMFAVDNVTGFIFVTKSFDLSDGKGTTFALQVYVADAANAELTSVAKLWIVVRPGVAAAIVSQAGTMSNATILAVIVCVMGFVAIALIIAIIVVVRTGRDLRKVHRRYLAQTTAERIFLQRKDSDLPNNNLPCKGDNENDLLSGSTEWDTSLDRTGGAYIWLPTPPDSVQRDCDLFKDHYRPPIAVGKIGTFLPDNDDRWSRDDRRSRDSLLERSASKKRLSVGYDAQMRQQMHSPWSEQHTLDRVS